MFIDAKKIGVGLAVLALAIIVFLFLSLPSHQSGPSTFAFEEGTLHTFATATLDGRFDKTVPTANLLVTEAEFSDLLLESCRNIFNNYSKFKNIGISHFSQPHSFQSNPLNLKMDFLLRSDDANSQDITDTLVITFRLTRNILALEGTFIRGSEFVTPDYFKDKNIDKEDVLTGKQDHPATRVKFRLPRERDAQTQELKRVSGENCRLFAEEAEPDFAIASGIEKVIQSRNK